MNAHELLADICKRCPEVEAFTLYKIFDVLSETLYQIDLEDGRSLRCCDIIGVKEFLEEAKRVAQAQGK